MDYRPQRRWCFSSCTTECHWKGSEAREWDLSPTGKRVSSFGLLGFQLTGWGSTTLTSAIYFILFVLSTKIFVGIILFILIWGAFLVILGSLRATLCNTCPTGNESSVLGPSDVILLGTYCTRATRRALVIFRGLQDYIQWGFKGTGDQIQVLEDARHICQSPPRLPQCSKIRAKLKEVYW